MAYPQTTTPTPQIFDTDTTTHLVEMPATVNSGDLLLTIAVNDDDNLFTTPTGWTELNQDTHSEAEVNFGVWAKVADGTEGGTTVDWETDGSEQVVATVYRVTSWYGTIAGVEVGTFSEGNSDIPDPPSLSPSWGAEDTLWIACYGNDSEETATAYPTNYTDGITASTGTGSGRCGSGSARRELNATSDNPGTFTLSSDEQWLGQTIAIRPASAPAAGKVPHAHYYNTIKGGR